MSRSILGIDPGLDGGLILLSTEGEILKRYEIPTLENKTKKKSKKVDPQTGEKKDRISVNRTVDTVALNRIFLELVGKVDHAILEQVASRPGQAAQAVFKFGRVYGFIEGLLAAHQIRYSLVTPAVWCKVIHAGITGDDAKDRSRLALSRLFPKADLRTELESGRLSKNAHEGLMDALLIAEWGRRKALVGEL